jgi:DNA-directed RNA polymerase II subunit RPB2
MGVYSSNYQMRMDTLAHVLYYPQKPMVITKPMKYLHFETLPSGINSIVGIACYSGYNQEDSIMMNQSAIDRGFMRSVFFRTYNDKESQSEKIRKPDMKNTQGLKHAPYFKLDKDGLVKPGAHVTGDDIIIGKIVKPKDQDFSDGKAVVVKKMFKDCSQALRHSEAGKIDTVMVTNEEDDYLFVKVKMRAIKIP